MSWGKFDSFVEQFETNPRSWLEWGKANDVDRFREARRAGKLTKGKPRVETFEMGQAEQLLAAIYVLMQQQIHVTAQKGAKHPKRFRGRPWTSVTTAYDALIEQDRLQLAEANRQFMAMFEFVPQAEFEADLAEHQADLAAGEQVTGPQRRALEAAEVATPASKPVPPSVADPFRTPS